jgi:hypothetical protein
LWEEDRVVGAEHAKSALSGIIGHGDLGDWTLGRAIRATAQEMEEHRARWLSP